MATPKEDLKTCTKCGEPKPRSEFYMHSRARRAAAKTVFGREREMCCGECKACARARRASYYGANRERVLAAQKPQLEARRNRIRNAVFAAYGGFKCACCGETGRLFLTLDHVGNDGADFRKNTLGDRTRAGIHTYNWIYRNGFPEGFQVLCMNCNHGKRMNNGICPHQVTSNDYPSTGVGSSGPKRTASLADEDIVSPATKVAAVIN